MSESLIRDVEDAAGKMAEAMDAWEKARRYCEHLAVALADSLLVYGSDASGVELYRRAKASEEAAAAFLQEAQAISMKAVSAWREHKGSVEPKEPSPAATGEGDEINSNR